MDFIRASKCESNFTDTFTILFVTLQNVHALGCSGVSLIKNWEKAQIPSKFDGFLHEFERNLIETNSNYTVM